MVLGGMKELQASGAVTIAQDEDSSVVWGMPGAAVKLGAADIVLPLNMIANEVLSHKKNEKKYGT